MPDELRGRLGSEYAPHPFALCPLDHTEGNVVRGQPIAFSITMFGRGISYFPFLLTAFEELGCRGLGADRLPFRLETVTDSLHENSRLLFDPAEHRVLGSPIVRDLRQMSENAARDRLAGAEGPVDVRVRFLSPTHLVRGGQSLFEPDLDALLAALHRRFEAFTLLHGEGPAAWDDSEAQDPPDPASMGWERARVSIGAEPFQEFGDTVAVLPWEWDLSRGTRVGDSRALRNAVSEVESDTSRLEWVDWDRVSNRQGRHVPMGGVIGDALYRGAPAECLPWLMAGQWTLAGKATVFGMGRYLADLEPAPHDWGVADSGRL
ncbi:MAG: CRISPR system precrRNA processing endoribonuclease RAMP protein Cas6 [Candidatus Wallbacteria bacterium]|nr:CRISPR system precrRNA processing endoribonuclease RAMP protein Cas6 [Candidatus Wallbacteria bacterium]